MVKSTKSAVAAAVRLANAIDTHAAARERFLALKTEAYRAEYHRLAKLLAGK